MLRNVVLSTRQASSETFTTDRAMPDEQSLSIGLPPISSSRLAPPVEWAG
jgi:hypothetical protein